MTTEEKIEFWAIVEVLGRKVFAGHISEQTIAGSAMLRVDIPDVKAVEEGVGVDRRVIQEATPGFTKFFGGGSIYSITPVTEEIARRTAANIRARPLTVFDFPRDPQARLGYQGDDDEDNWR